jgi:L-alanine-DL-glutamate epimerase-like enolase superfamily enzyme
MQITKADVTPVELNLGEPILIPGYEPISAVTAAFIRLETQSGQSAWGCGVAHPALNSQEPEEFLTACHQAADQAPDLHPVDIAYSLSQLTPILQDMPAAQCAFDLAFHDLLGLAAGMPLYRLLGGYRHKIQTSVTIPLGSVDESVEIAKMRAHQGFRMLKVKGGMDPQLDIQRIRAIHRALPTHTLRLDADGCYSVQESLSVARILGERIEMLEQPTPADDLDGLCQVTRQSPVPVLADQSITEPGSALTLAAGRCADGFSIKIGSCGGISNARQMDGVARSAGLVMMVSCLIEPALLAAAGLSFALSSPGVGYADLDGHLDLLNDPTLPGFRLEDSWLIATDIPGLGCTVEL